VADQGVRDAVIMAVDLDVIVEGDADREQDFKIG
jgi:hypothetical protein